MMDRGRGMYNESSKSKSYDSGEGVTQESRLRHLSNQVTKLIRNR